MPRLRAALLAILVSGLAGTTAASLAQETGAPEQDRRALLVGVSKYAVQEESFTTLEGPPDDAREFAALLRDRFEFPEENVVVLVDEEATRDAIVSRFRGHLIEPSRQGTIAVFYFSGHGSQALDEDGDEGEGEGGLDETLIPYDTLGRSNPGRDLRDDQLHELFQELDARCRLSSVPGGPRNAGQVLGIFDACHSGGGNRSAGSSTGATAKLFADSTRTIAPSRSSALNPTRSLRTEPADLLGATFLTACQEDEVAYEGEVAGSDGKRGRFTVALSRALREARPDETWKQVIARTRALLWKLDEERVQTPGLRGDATRRVFGGGFTALPPEFAIQRADRETGLTIEAGCLDLLRTGTLLEILPRGDPAGASLRATVTSTTFGLSVAALAPNHRLRGAEVRRLPDTHVARFLPGEDPRVLTARFDPAAPPPESLAAVLLRFDWKEIDDWKKIAFVDDPEALLTIGWDEARGFLATTRDGVGVLPHPFRPTRSAQQLVCDLGHWSVRRILLAAGSDTQRVEEYLLPSYRLGWKVPVAGTRLSDLPFIEDRDHEIWSDPQDGSPPILHADRLGWWTAEPDPRKPQIAIEFRAVVEELLHLDIFDLMPNWQSVHWTSQRGFAVDRRRTILINVTDSGWTYGRGGLYCDSLPPEVFKFFVSTQERSLLEGLQSPGIVPPEEVAPPDETLRSTEVPELDAGAVWEFAFHIRSAPRALKPGDGGDPP